MKFQILDCLVIFETNRMYLFITNNHASFHLWWKKNLFNHQKVQNIMKMIIEEVKKTWIKFF